MIKAFLINLLLSCVIIIQALPTNAFLSPIPSLTSNQNVPYSNLPTQQLSPQHELQQVVQHHPIPKQQSKSLTRMNLIPHGGAASMIALPSLTKILTTCLLPTLIGLWKYEYGVSYAYGTSTALSSFFILQSVLNAPPSAFTALVQIHAAAIIFYGVRLNVFLLYRELFLERFRRMRERIEDRQTAKEDGAGTIGRLVNRIPFILSCSLLYMGLVAPPLASGMLLEMMSTNQGGVVAVASNSVALGAYKALVGLTWAGFIMGAIGDLTKTIVKGWKGPDHLVTGGVYALFRHPNYTGEVIGWTSNFLASIAAIILSGYGIKMSLIVPMLLGCFGLLGIVFVLTAATTNLEKRQKEKYGGTDAYENWNAWAGFQLPTK